MVSHAGKRTAKLFGQLLILSLVTFFLLSSCTSKKSEFAGFFRQANQADKYPGEN